MKYAIFFIFLVLIGSAYACPSEQEFKFELKKGLFNYLENPQSSKLTIFEVQDLLETYLTQDITILNCETFHGSHSGITIGTILSKTQGISKNIIPRCSDGTYYGECADIMPKFCYSGTIKEMCYGPDLIIGTDDDCGCRNYEVCETDGTCTMPSIQCYNDANCGVSSFVGPTFCNSTRVMQDYLNFTCYNPGSSSAYCNFTQKPVEIQVCTMCMNGACT